MKFENYIYVLLLIPIIIGGVYIVVGDLSSEYKHNVTGFEDLSTRYEKTGVLLNATKDAEQDFKDIQASGDPSFFTGIIPVFNLLKSLMFNVIPVTSEFINNFAIDMGIDTTFIPITGILLAIFIVGGLFALLYVYSKVKP